MGRLNGDFLKLLFQSMSGPGALPTLSVSGPALCVGFRHCLTLCPAPAVSVSGPGFLCVGPRPSLCRTRALSVSRPPRFLCRRVTDRRAPTQSPKSTGRAPGRHRETAGPDAESGGKALGPDTDPECRAATQREPGPDVKSGAAAARHRDRRVSEMRARRERRARHREWQGERDTDPEQSARRSLCRGPAQYVSRARRSLCQAPAPSASGAGALCVARRFLCRVPALSVSRSGALCVGRRSLCRDPALSVSGPSALCVATRRSVCRPALSVSWVLAGSDPHVTHLVRRAVPPIRSAGPQL